MNNLLYFYGEDCPDCIRMQARLDRLEKEERIVLTKLEVWNNPANDELCMQYDKDNTCGGVPFFINTQTGHTLCGEVTYKELKDWAVRKQE
jgi:thiol-disulfide isomerase/thioredoxin